MVANNNINTIYKAINVMSYVKQHLAIPIYKQFL